MDPKYYRICPYAEYGKCGSAQRLDDLCRMNIFRSASKADSSPSDVFVTPKVPQPHPRRTLAKPAPNQGLDTFSNPCRMFDDENVLVDTTQTFEEEERNTPTVPLGGQLSNWTLQVFFCFFTRICIAICDYRTFCVQRTARMATHPGPPHGDTFKIFLWFYRKSESADSK